MKKYKTAKDMIIAKSKVNKDTGCWDWIHSLSGGYGNCAPMYWAKIYKVTRGHQVSYIAFKGYYDRSLEISHTCHNKKCVNPEHLIAVSHVDNLSMNITNPESGRVQLKDEKSIINDSYYLTPTQLSDKYGYSALSIKKVLNGTYSEMFNEESIMKSIPSNRRGHKLSQDIVDKIFKLKEEGHKQYLIGIMVGCSESMVCRVLKGSRRQRLL